MSKRDFAELAKAMRQIRPVLVPLEPDGTLTSLNLAADSEIARRVWRKAVRTIATVCKRHNQRFDEDEFYRACGA